MRVLFISLGCDKNLVDSEMMLGLLKEKGHEITLSNDTADAVVINTCGFIRDAANEGVQHILEQVEFKRKKDRLLIVTGCMAQRYKDEIFQEFPEVDAVIGVDQWPQLGAVLDSLSSGKKNIALYDTGSLQNFSRVLSTANYAYLKIAEGCDNACTYCTIPSIRGGYRSRTIESLVDEARALAAQGVKELVLVAQDTALYGKDRGKPCLEKLLRALSEISEIKWIRILYCYPEHLTDEIIAEMAANEKVCKYLDIPLQHSADKILKRMGRRSTTKTINEIIDKLRSAMPEIVLRTTFIVGFPGETRQDFEELLDFVKEKKFHRVGAFKYSREESTPAYDFPKQVSEGQKTKRLDALMTIQRDISRELGLNQVGRKLLVLIEEQLNNETYRGRSQMDCPEVDGYVYVKSAVQLTLGQFVTVRVTGSADYDLQSEYVE